MNRKVLGWSLVILIFVHKSLGCNGCSSWKQETMRMLVVLDTDNTRSLENVLGSDITDLNYNARYNERECIPQIRYNILYLNDSLNELDVIRETQTPFKYYKYCVIIFAAKTRAGRYILQYATKEKIPVINIIVKDVNHSLNISLSVWRKLQVLSLSSKTSIDDQIALIAPTLKSLKWTKMAMIYDNSVHSLQIAASLEQTLSSNKLVMLNSIYVTKYTELNIIATKLDLLKTDCSSFLILSHNPAIINSIFRAASWLDLLGQTHMWMIVSDVGHDLLVQDTLPYEFFVVHPFLERWTQTSLIQDAVSLMSKGLLRMTKATKDYSELCSCRCECTSFKRSFYRHMREITFTGKTGRIQFDDKGERRFGIYDISVMAVSPDGRLLSKDIGAWDGTSVRITSPVSRPKMRVIINEYPPNIMTVEKPKNGPCPSGASLCIRSVKSANGSQDISRCCYGFAIDVLHLVKEAMGFDPELRFSEDGQFGVFNEKNKTWNGIVKELLEDKGDITLDLYISARRATVLDFTEPYAPSGIRLLVKERSGKRTSIYWLSYLRPFTSNVWLTLLGSMGIMSLFLWLVEKLAPCRISDKPKEEPIAQEEDQDQVEKRYSFDFKLRGYAVNQFELEREHLKGDEEGEEEEPVKEETKPPPSYGPFGFDNAICFTLALAFGRPADEAKPMLHGARLASVAFGVAMMMLISSYSANLAAFLIVEDKYTAVESIYDEKIANPPPGFRYGTVKGSYMADFFANAESAYMRNMWYHMKGNNVESSSEGVRKVKSGELDVFISDHISLVYESLNDLDCELKVVGEPFAMSGASLAVKKGSPWFSTLSDVLQQLKSKDLTDFIQKFWVQKYKCSNEKPPSQLQIQDLSGLFLQLAIASVACFLGTFIHNAFGALAQRYGKKSLRNVRNSYFSDSDEKSRELVPVVKCNLRKTDSPEADV